MPQLHQRRSGWWIAPGVLGRPGPLAWENPEKGSQMARLKRFEHHRFLGARDTMVLYDCDAADDYAELSARDEAEHLTMRNLISTFGPDLATEAVNRGFRPR